MMPAPHWPRCGGSILDKYEVRLLNRAMRDLDDIYGYIARTLSEPGTATDLIDTLESEILSLEYLPYRCPQRRTGAYAKGGYRQLVVKNYLVIYRVSEAQKQVTIVTIRYAKSSF